MSRIKDLLAEEENIDDLKLPRKYDLSFFKAVQEIDKKRLANSILEACKGVVFEDWLAENAEFELGDDDGEPCMFFENFTELCDECATGVLDGMIEDQHLDISDEEYTDVCNIAADLIANHYADYESELCADAFKDWQLDNKYKLDELRERNGQC